MNVTRQLNVLIAQFEVSERGHAVDHVNALLDQGISFAVAYAPHGEIQISSAVGAHQPQTTPDVPPQPEKAVA